MIVVDTTVLADLLVGAERQKKAAKLLIEIDPQWISVGLWRYELGNVLWKTARFVDEANFDANRLLSLSELLVEETIEPSTVHILEIAMETGLSFYDASYVWLARQRGLKLRTRDKKILQLCSDVAEPMPVAD